MRKNISIAWVIAAIIIVGLLGYFLYNPILNRLNLGLDLKGGLRVVLQAQENQGEVLNSDTINKAIGIIKNRVDKLGVKESSVYAQGKDRVVVEIAGEDDPESAVDILKNTAQLEFWDENGNVLLTGKNLKEAKAESAGDGQNYRIAISFDKEGADLFASATAANIGKPLAIVLDNQVISAPRVESAISGGSAVITGSFTAKEAQDLAVLLQSGALPVSLTVVEKRSVGPTLGADSLEKSIKASVVGLIAILIFLLGYYRLPGLVADISMVLYTIIVLGVMALLNSVITVPGIAGFVLSIGMAVDANVIIYERIKEEMRLGKTLKASIESGYNRAFWTIFDSNLTTLITAVVLFYFGTGAVRSFAITLGIGLITTVVVVLTFSRYLLNWIADFIKNTKAYGI